MDFILQSHKKLFPLIEHHRDRDAVGEVARGVASVLISDQHKLRKMVASMKFLRY